MLREPWRTRLLFLSVAGNIFAVALIGGHIAMRGQPHGPPGSAAIVDHMAREMPPDDAARFRATMAEDRDHNDRAHARMEEARRALSRAIGGSPYDEAAVRQAMHDWQQAWLDWSNDLGASLLKAFPGLSPDGRRRLAEAGQRHGP